MVKKLFVERIYKKIYIDPHNIYVRIHAKNYSFWYRSVAYDDLNMMCRENLKFWESSSREIFSESQYAKGRTCVSFDQAIIV